MSAKLPAGDGLWPAIWLLPSNLTLPPEIDITVMLGSNPDVIYVGTHSGVGGSNVATTTAVYVGDTSQGFNTYAVDWEPNTITWYFDGNEIFSEPTPADMHQPMYLLINLAVGGAGSWPGEPTSASEFPATMEINYVRIYASPNSIVSGGTEVLAPSTPVTILGDNVVATAPTATSVTAPPANADLTVGTTVTLTVDFSTAVTVAGGTPSLALIDGGTAIYQSGSGTDALVFKYTVASGQNTGDPALAPTAALALNGATILDAAGNNANLASANGYALAGTLEIDTTAPVITSITTSSASADLSVGGEVTLTVTFSHAVTVSGGTPTLLLNDGGTAVYQSGSGTDALVFLYTVTAGQNTADLALAASNAVSLNGATIRDGDGNNAILNRANGRVPAGAVQIDTTPPAVASITTSPDSGDMTTGVTFP